MVASVKEIMSLITTLNTNQTMIACMMTWETWTMMSVRRRRGTRYIYMSTAIFPPHLHLIYPYLTQTSLFFSDMNDPQEERAQVNWKWVSICLLIFLFTGLVIGGTAGLTYFLTLETKLPVITTLKPPTPTTTSTTTMTTTTTAAETTGLCH